MNIHSPHVAQRAALYLRVSTVRQAEHDVSIPDQRKQGEAYCASRGYQLVETFVEAGASATNDRRPEFQRMIEAGTTKPAPFDVVVVHSFSRFFRDHFELEFYVRKLAKNGVKLVSITQEMGDDPMHVMMRQIMALFDEYQSKENAKHVLRALKENARQGFWNGSLPPIGYRVIDAEQRGSKMKKKLEIDPLHADTVRMIFRLALEGDGTSGPMGVKAIVNHLNKNGMFTRSGGRWGIGQLHRILTRRTYVGEHQFNKRTKTKELKPVEEVVTVGVPPLIDIETFDAIQRRLQANNPKVTPPRVVSGPNLLTGICYCGNCGGAMTLRTGKNGRYRYYACSIRARQGETGCKGRAIPMDKLDRMVVGHIEERLLDPERIEEVLASLLDRRQEGVERRSKHIAELNQRAAEADMRLKRLYDAIEAGSLDPAESALGERITGLSALRDQARADAARTEAMLASTAHQSITGAAVREMASEARSRLRQGKGGYRREHVRAFAQRVEVADDAIRIMGTKSTLLRTLVAAKGGKSAGIGVPGFVPKWRRGWGSITATTPTSYPCRPAKHSPLILQGNSLDLQKKTPPGAIGAAFRFLETEKAQPPRQGSRPCVLYTIRQIPFQVAIR
ncbi:recombinase family protein [Rhodomicrobium lacus]|uniref:recombinase family protein n=1 Tax=Rhodomicrobium lacus TaxID=2498452 RepID=UPI0026E33903|nr:recombinase family protein [Rhodomicrobium lacus]WKW52032.1 recombinase family protein [Rhodomicrobium lacus]